MRRTTDKKEKKNKSHVEATLTWVPTSLYTCRGTTTFFIHNNGVDEEICEVKRRQVRPILRWGTPLGAPQ